MISIWVIAKLLATIDWTCWQLEPAWVCGAPWIRGKYPWQVIKSHSPFPPAVSAGGSLQAPICLMCTSLRCGRKLDYQEKTQYANWMEISTRHSCYKGPWSNHNHDQDSCFLFRSPRKTIGVSSSTFHCQFLQLQMIFFQFLFYSVIEIWRCLVSYIQTVFYL